MKMRIEQDENSGKGELSNVSRKNKKRQKILSQIQKLYETCKEVFADCGPGIVPSPENIEKLASVLDAMTPIDVGLKPDMPFFSSERAPVITYLHLHECDKFSIGIFCLPPTSVIPLHNHPGMTVFGKLLFGTMHIKSFDWSNEINKNINDITTNVITPSPRIHPDGLRFAKIKVDSEFTAPCRTSILFPNDGGNMHCFTAKTACAVLDVLGPPYSDPDGRHCQYYLEFPFDNSDEGKEEYAWLKERDKPEDLCVVGVPYFGPKIAKR